MSVANLNDMATLALDTVFGARVNAAMILFCATVVPSEAITGTTIALHQARKLYAAGVLNNPSLFKPLFVNVVATNQIVANDATVGGTLVGQIPAAIATAALLCTDIDINNAVASAFNAFIGGI